MKTKLLYAVAIASCVFTLSGCGQYDKVVAKVAGGGVEVCQDGVVYLQFASGVSVKYAPDGKIATCK